MKLSQALTVATLAVSTLTLTNVASADTELQKNLSSLNLTTQDLRLAVDASFSIKSLTHQPSASDKMTTNTHYVIAQRASIGAFALNGHAHYFVYKNPSLSVAGGVDLGYSTGSGSTAVSNYVQTSAGSDDAKNQSLSYQDFRYGVSVFSQFNTDTYFTPFVKLNVGRIHTNFNEFKEKGWYYGLAVGATVHNGFYTRVNFELGRVQDKSIKNRSSDKYQSIGLAFGYSF